MSECPKCGGQNTAQAQYADGTKDKLWIVYRCKRCRYRFNKKQRTWTERE